ncbi:hypothetical protein ALCH109712_15795 [Alkalicoccus chagannorensis]
MGGDSLWAVQVDHPPAYLSVSWTGNVDGHNQKKASAQPPFGRKSEGCRLLK